MSSNPIPLASCGLRKAVVVLALAAPLVPVSDAIGQEELRLPTIEPARHSYDAYGQETDRTHTDGTLIEHDWASPGLMGEVRATGAGLTHWRSWDWLDNDLVDGAGSGSFVVADDNPFGMGQMRLRTYGYDDPRRLDLVEYDGGAGLPLAIETSASTNEAAPSRSPPTGSVSHAGSPDQMAAAPPRRGTPRRPLVGGARRARGRSTAPRG